MVRSSDDATSRRLKPFKRTEVRLTHDALDRDRRRRSRVNPNIVVAEMVKLMRDRLRRGMAWDHTMDELAAMTADQRGSRVELTLEERMRLDIRATRCF